MTGHGPTPVLTARDLEDELRRIHANRHRTLTTAFYGTPAAGLDFVTVTLDGDGQATSASTPTSTLRVVHATSELAARRALSGAGSEPVVLLFDYDGHVPFDVTSRLAGGKVRPVTDERRLARLFGATTVSPDVLASPALKAALLADGEGGYGALAGLSLDLDTAWRKYLERMAGLPPEARLSEDRMVIHCAAASDPMGFRGLLGRRPPLREALHLYLGERAGPIARLAWRAWERGAGREVAAFAFIVQAALPALPSSEYLQVWLGERLRGLDPELKNIVRGQPALLERWGRLADRLALQMQHDDASLTAILELCERWVSEDDRLGELLADSQYLAVAGAAARARLAAALNGALPRPNARAVADVRRSLETLAKHRSSEREPGKTQLGRARMAARLVGWLARHEGDGADSGAGDSGLASDVVATLAASYAREGGFVDRARGAARGPTTDAMDQAIAAVVARADAARDAMDERFARALPAWAARRKTDRVVPIDQALDRFAVDFLAGGEHRKLMVLLLDGMAWASAVELLLDLENQRWGPVRWQPRGMSAGAAGDLLPPMLAALPTVTEVSRAAFFAGRAPEVGDRGDTGEDPARFDGHAGLRKLLGHGPKLLLRTDTEARPGHASKAALDLVASEARVVAFVVNAIDDQLKVGAGLEVAYEAKNIKAMWDLLPAATQAQRAVLLVADHGHVRGDRFESRWPGGDLSSARARELGPDESPKPHEIALEEGVWRSKKRNRLALLYRETDTYGTPHGRGTHGGASLAEVVTPAILIAADELTRAMGGIEDKELDLRSFPRPRWWDLEPEPVVAAAAAPTRESAPPRKKVEDKPTAQLSIPLAAAPPLASSPPLAASPPVAASKWSVLLRASEYYVASRGRERELWDTRVLPIVELLADHGGTMPDVTFAPRAGVPRFRVASLVSELSERLNLDQHQVLSFDRVAGQVRLELELLQQLFSE